MKCYSSFAVRDDLAWFCNDWSTKQTPPSSQYTKAIFNNAACPTQSVIIIEDCLIFYIELGLWSFSFQYTMYKIITSNSCVHIPGRFLPGYGRSMFVCRGNASSPTTTYGRSGSVVPGSGQGLGSDKEPDSRACPNSEFDSTPPSLWQPASPRSTRMNLQFAHWMRVILVL